MILLQQKGSRLYFLISVRTIINFLEYFIFLQRLQWSSLPVIIRCVKSDLLIKCVTCDESSNDVLSRKKDNRALTLDKNHVNYYITKTQGVTDGNDAPSISLVMNALLLDERCSNNRQVQPIESIMVDDKGGGIGGFLVISTYLHLLDETSHRKPPCTRS